MGQIKFDEENIRLNRQSFLYFYMQISKIISISTIDFPNYPCQVVFSQGCNLNCLFCHNFPLIPHDPACEIPNKIIIQKLNKNYLVDAISFSGGEPLIQSNDLIEIIEGVNSSYISIDTNGLFPESLRKLLRNSKKLIRIALDIKTSFKKYKELCGDINPGHTEEFFELKITDTIKSTIDAGRILDIRTTFSPDFCDKKDIQFILMYLKKINFKQNYRIQPFRWFGVRSQYNFYEPKKIEIQNMLNEILKESDSKFPFLIHL